MPTDTSTQPAHCDQHNDAQNELQTLFESRPRPASKAFVQNYVNGMFRALEAIHSNPDDVRAELKKVCDFLNRDKPFDYVNYACELALASGFKTDHPERFSYQVPTPFAETATGRQRSFDFRFYVKDAQYNIEVKNFSRDWKRKDTQLPIKLFLPPEQANALFAAGLRPEGTSRGALHDLLMKANDQLFRPENGLSVVFVCCNDVDEYADAMECLVGPHGLATDTDGFGELPNIDGIVLCMLGLFHHAALDASSIQRVLQDDSVTLADDFDTWRYESGIPVGIFPVQKVSVRSEVAAEDFVRLFQLTNGALDKFRKEHPGDLQAAVFALFNESIKSHPRR